MIGATLVDLGVAVGLVALIALHLLPTGLSAMASPVSQYGISRYRGGYRVQTISFGIAGIGAAIGLSAFPDSTAVVGLCACFAGARMAISWFPMDLPGGDRSSTGRWHGLLAIGAFGAIGLAAAQLPRMISRDHLLAAAGLASGGVALLMLVCLAAMAIERRSHGGHFGLAERAFYGCMIAWFTLVTILLTTGR